MEFVILDTKNLNPLKKKAYALFSDPKFRCCLEGKNPDHIKYAKQIALGVEEKGVPIGLALASYFETLDYSEIHSIYVHTHDNKAYILKKLLTEIERKLLTLNSSLITYLFFDSDPIIKDLLPLLKKKNWMPPKLKIIRYFFDTRTFNPPWYKLSPPLPSGYTEFPWKMIKNEELKHIQKDYQQGQFTTHVSPFFDEEMIEPINSIGLRYKNQVIGWMICHRVSHDTIRYTSFFIKPEFFFAGCSIRLLANAIRLHQKSPIKWALFELNLESVPLTWINFVQKRLSPHAFAKTKIYETWKSIQK